VKALEYQCKEAQKLADLYRDQVIQLEDGLSRIREEGDVGKELFKVSLTLLCTLANPSNDFLLVADLFVYITV